MKTRSDTLPVKGSPTSAAIASPLFYKPMVIATGAIILPYVICNLFVIGGDNFIYTLNYSLTILLALLTTFFSFTLWKSFNKKYSSRLTWGGLMAGWTLWSIADVLRVFYSSIHQGIPHPAPVDYFWLGGNILMGCAFYIRTRELPTKPNTRQQAGLWLFSMAAAGAVVYFVIRPMVPSVESANWLEYAPTVFQPLADLALLIIAFRLVLFQLQGKHNLGWKLFASGFILRSLSNLVLIYVELQGQYYPGMQANLMSTLAVDVPYNLSYLFAFWGLYSLRALLAKNRPLEPVTDLRLVANTTVLLFLGWDDKVISVSNNFESTFTNEMAKGRKLEEIFGIHDLETNKFLEQVRQDGKVADYPIHLTTRRQTSEPACLSGIAAHSLSGEYTGCNLVIRLLVEDDYTLNEKLSADQNFVAAHLLKVSGSRMPGEIGNLLLGYYQTYLKHLHNLIYRTSGEYFAAEFSEYLKQFSRENGWDLKFDHDNMIMNSDYPVDLLRDSLPALKEAGVKFAYRLVDPTMVEHEMHLLTVHLGENVHKNVTFHRNRG